MWTVKTLTKEKAQTGWGLDKSPPSGVPSDTLIITHNNSTPSTTPLCKRPVWGGFSACPKLWRFAGIRRSA
jgi:hypothetical protein